MLSLEGVSKHYCVGNNIIKAVDNVCLAINRNDFVMVTGRSGSGKTTLLSLIGGLAKPTSGRILLKGVDISSLSDKDLSGARSRTIGFIFQFPSLIPFLRVLDNVRLPASFTQEKFADLDRAKELIRTVGLSKRSDSYPSQLSMGEQKRVAIARALVNEPEIVLADEPTSDLDEATEKEIMQIIKEVREKSTTVVMVTHSADLAHYGSRCFKMTAGVLREA